MDAWLDGWWMDGWMDGRTDGRTDGRSEGRSEGRRDGRTDGRTDGWIDRWDWLILCKAAKCIWVYICTFIFNKQTSFQNYQFGFDLKRNSSGRT